MSLVKAGRAENRIDSVALGRLPVSRLSLFLSVRCVVGTQKDHFRIQGNAFVGNEALLSLSLVRPDAPRAGLTATPLNGCRRPGSTCSCPRVASAAVASTAATALAMTSATIFANSTPSPTKTAAAAANPGEGTPTLSGDGTTISRPAPNLGGQHHNRGGRERGDDGPEPFLGTLQLAIPL